MRVALLHNSSAGGEDHTDRDLKKLIQRAGHELVHLVTRLGDLTEALHETPCDLVVVAGGDGTVGRAACELSGWQVPLSILPLGTANNTAVALKLPNEPKKLAKSWHQAARVGFDLGLLSDGVVRRRFAEAVGWGVFASAIVAAKRSLAGKTIAQTLKRDRKLFRAVATGAATHHYTIDIDGRDRSGDYLLVEVMNVPLLGPQLDISPHSDPGDGRFELVLVKETERAALEQLAIAGEPLPLGIERGQHIRVETSNPVLHRDGRVSRYSGTARSFEIEVEPSAVQYLR